MNNSNLQSTPLLPAAKPALWLALFASLVGFVDSTYLTAHHYVALPLPCSLAHGCETVLTSPYAMVGPIPLAAFGVAFYLFVFFFALYLYTAPALDRFSVRLFLATTIAGFLASCVFVAMQAFLIKAFCQYCLLSALCTVILLGAGVWFAQRSSY